MNISRKTAEIILKMEDVCFSNGAGPDTSELIRWIFNTYPELECEYSYLSPVKAEPETSSGPSSLTWSELKEIAELPNKIKDVVKLVHGHTILDGNLIRTPLPKVKWRKL